MKKVITKKAPLFRKENHFWKHSIDFQAELICQVTMGYVGYTITKYTQLGKVIVQLDRISYIYFLFAIVTEGKFELQIMV